MAELEELRERSYNSDDLREEVNIDIEKLQYMRDYYEWLDRLVDAFEDHDIFNLVPIKKPQNNKANEQPYTKTVPDVIVTPSFLRLRFKSHDFIW